jgi:uncharacterized protein (DUF2141 family)
MRLSLLLAAALLSASAAGAQETVTVTVTGVRAGPGPLLASLDSRETFMRGGVKRARAEAHEGAVTLTFEDVVPGDYVLMVMHDQNDDGRLGMGPMGPTEGWAMSNVSGPLAGMPTFDALKFTVADAPVTLTAPMQY